MSSEQNAISKLKESLINESLYAESAAQMGEFFEEVVTVNSDFKSKNRKKESGSPKKVMVCVTRQKSGERLIRHGADMAEAVGAELVVLHVVVENEKILGNPNESEALEMLFRLTNDYGAQMHVLRCDNALEGIAEAVVKNDVGLMIMGASPQNAQSLSQQIKMRLPYIDFVVLTASQWVDQIA